MKKFWLRMESCCPTLTLEVSFPQQSRQTGLSGHDNISDIHFEYSTDLPETNFVLASLIHD